MQEPARANRCQAVTHKGEQCKADALLGTNRCRHHSGVSLLAKKDLRTYRLAHAEFRDRHQELSSFDKDSSLGEEIALVRQLVERRLNSCKNDTELLASCSSLNELLLTLERLRRSAHQIDRDSGHYITRSQLRRLGQRVAEIIVNRLEGIPDYHERIDQILEDLTEIFTSSQ
jgi:hypothetical protein